MASNIKFVYFTLRGRGELVRFILHSADVDFIDERIEWNDWPAMKATSPCPTGQLPYAEIDGKVYTDSLALARFFAKRYGLEGKTDLDILRADTVVCQMNDFRENVCNYVHAKTDKERKQLKDLFTNEKSPKQFGVYEKMLKENGTGYMIGDSLTIADLAAFDLSEQVEMDVPGFFSKYPHCEALRKKIQSLPGIAKYLATRKHSDV